MTDFILGSPGAVLLVLSGLSLIFSLLVWLPIAALQVHWLWSIGIFLFAPISLIFGIKYWSIARRPLIWATSSLIVCMGIFVVRALAMFWR